MFEATKAMERRKRYPEYKTYFTGSGIDLHLDSDCIGKFSVSFPIQSCLDYTPAIGNIETIQNVLNEEFDFLHSSHCLEHVDNPVKAIKSWIRVVKTGGYLVVVVPDEIMYEKGAWPSIMNTQHKYSFRYGGYSERESSIDVLSWFDQFLDVDVLSLKRLTDNYYESERDLTISMSPAIECGIEIVMRKKQNSAPGVLDWALNGFCFMLNSLAMGDVIAAVPVVKYMIERHYTDSSLYKVVAKEMFRPFFWFVSDSNFTNFEDKENDWGIPKGWALGVLNQKKEAGTGIIRNTPKAIHLTQFASFKLCDRNIPLEYLNYVSLPKVDISRFGVDFGNTVIIVSSYRDETRMWESSYILELAEYIKSKGCLPVFIGKTDMNLDTHLIPKTSLPNDVSYYGLDLRNDTTVEELATIIGEARAIVGLDSGPIHLAGCTSTPIICGYTSVDPVFRIPLRTKGEFHPIVPLISCCHCESNWASHFHNYEVCYLIHNRNRCCKEMTAQRFIEHLEQYLN